MISWRPQKTLYQLVKGGDDLYLGTEEGKNTVPVFLVTIIGIYK
jgi:hypothetical protein